MTKWERELIARVNESDRTEFEKAFLTLLLVEHFEGNGDGDERPNSQFGSAPLYLGPEP